MAFEERDLSAEELLSIIDDRLERMEQLIEDTTNYQKYELPESINAIKANINSADHGVWGIKSATENINTISIFIGRIMLIQTILLAFIAWRLF